MPPKRDSQSGSVLIEDLVAALSDKRVVEAVVGILESKLQSLVRTISGLQEENKSLTKDLANSREKIDLLENQIKLDNLVIAGLPIANYAEAATAANDVHESNTVTEQAVLKFANDVMNVPLQTTDISVAHRLGRGKRDSSDTAPPRVIVRFTNRKARNMIYAARRNLQKYAQETGHSVYVNEDLTSLTADLFRRVREKVKLKVFHSCWTSGGAVFVKKSPDRSSVPLKVSLSTDLLTL